MYKVAVVGDKESILGFSSIGIDAYPAYNEKDVEDILPKLINDNYAIIYVTEKIYIDFEENIKKISKDKNVAITTIPSLNENKEVGAERIKEMVKNAIGMEIKL